MSSQLQIDANRKNAEKSTGPTTPEGKAICSQNSLKTGLDAKSEITRMENQADYDVLTAEYYDFYVPATPSERCLVDKLIRSEWLGRRYMSAEATIWEREFNALAPADSRNMGLVYVRRSEDFTRVDHRMNSAHRNFDKALTRLMALQAQRAAEPLPTPPLLAPAIPFPSGAPQPTNLVPTDPIPPPPPLQMPSPAAATKPLNPKLALLDHFSQPAEIHPIDTPNPAPNATNPIPTPTEDQP